MSQLKLLLHSVKGLCRKPHSIRKISIFAVSVSVFYFTSLLLEHSAKNTILIFCLRWMWIPMSLIFLIISHGETLKYYSFKTFFQSIGFWGFDGEIPTYEMTTVVNRYLKKIRFKSKIHICEWEKIIPNLEMLFNKRIYKIENLQGDITIIDIYIIEKNLPNFIEWDNAFMKDGRKFAIGEGYEGKIIWDAASLAHGIIAGATGGGKTALLRCIIHQAINKKFNVSVLDFKGGGDFTDLENGYGSIIISEPQIARDVLISLIVEVRYRLEQFKKTGVSNIDKYNALGCEQFLPWLLVIDETAEILDVKPKDKAEKELYIEIDQSLRTLARISRAAGVHILLGIIRPDSSILDGQIKNNMLWRACGYFADSAASQIVLENDKATGLPPDIKGRFIIGEEEVQAYYLPLSSESKD